MRLWKRVLTNSVSADRRSLVMGTLGFVAVLFGALFAAPSYALEPLWSVKLDGASFTYYGPQNETEAPEMGVTLAGGNESRFPVIAPTQSRFVGGYTSIRWKGGDGRSEEIFIDIHGRYRMNWENKNFSGYLAKCSQILK